MRARLPQVCLCGRHIRVGDPIVKIRGSWRCADCTEERQIERDAEAHERRTRDRTEDGNG